MEFKLVDKLDSEYQVEIIPCFEDYEIFLDIAIFLIRLKIRDCLKVKLVQSIRLIRMM